MATLLNSVGASVVSQSLKTTPVLEQQTVVAEVYGREKPAEFPDSPCLTVITEAKTISFAFARK
jgi:hypothetical protein